MKKKEVLILIAVCILFCTGAFTMVFKSALKSAARAIEAVAPNAGSVVKAASDEIVEDTIDLKEFKELKLDVASLNTYIEPGDGYKLEYRVRKKYVPQIDEKGDKLTIKQPSHFSISFGNLFDDEEEYYRLTVPKDAGMMDFDLESASGSLNVEDLQIKGKIEISSGAVNLRNIEGEDLKLGASSGNLNLEDVNAKDLTVKITSGHVTATKCAMKKLEADMTSGNMDLEDIKFDKAEFDVTSGNVDAEVIGREEDYSYKLKSTSGDLTINGKSFGDKYKSGDDKDHMISVDMTSGNVDISFSE